MTTNTTDSREPRVRFMPETYDARRREVREMVEEADRQDDELAGPDSLADALMEIAEGWAEQAAAEARRELDVGVLRQAMGAVLDTTTRERLLPYTDKLAAAYLRLLEPKPVTGMDPSWVGRMGNLDD